jgi:hypothetical protein
LELSRRVKNTLAVVEALARQTITKSVDRQLPTGRFTAFDRLRTLDLAADEDGSTPLLVMLDDTAAQCLVPFAQLMQERKEMTIGLMRSAIGKPRGLVLRLSLVLEYLRWCGEDGYAAPPDTITEHALIAAARFVSE